MGDTLRKMRTGAMYAIAAVALLVAILCGAAYWYCLYVPGRPFKGPLPPASPEEIALAPSLQRHVAAIASQPHNVRHYEALEAAAAYIERTLKGFGYAVTPQIYEVHDRAVRNLAVTIEPAASSASTETVVVGAHYDSAGDAPGANDNGTGTAAVIELARLLRGAHLKRRLRFVLFVNEEPPYFQTPDMGSFRYAQMLAERGEPVAAMISLETLGFYSDQPGSQAYPPPFALFYPDRGDFIAFVGMPGSRNLVHKAIGSFRRHAAFPSIGGVAPGAIPGIDWSDHWSFVQHGFPAIMITDTAPFRYPHYHRLSDTPDKVDYGRLARVTLGLERVIRELAE
jgi:Zn-dependent M28 family amino/carboxypeptidase